jgi:hypothetical protein
MFSSPSYSHICNVMSDQKKLAYLDNSRPISLMKMIISVVYIDFWVILCHLAHKSDYANLPLFIFWSPFFSHFIYIANPFISHLACKHPVTVYLIFYDAWVLLEKAITNFRSNARDIL